MAIGRLQLGFGSSILEFLRGDCTMGRKTLCAGDGLVESWAFVSRSTSSYGPSEIWWYSGLSRGHSLNVLVASF